MNWLILRKIKHISISTLTLTILLFSPYLFSKSFDDSSITSPTNSSINRESLSNNNDDLENILKSDEAMNDLLRALGDPYNAITNNGGSGTTWTDPAQRVGDISYALSGFVNQTDSTISFVNGTRTFTIQPTAPLTQYLVYFKGKYFTKTTAETFQIANQEGMHYIYFNGITGALEEFFTFPAFDNGIIVAFLYWSVSDQKAIIFGEERHACHRDIAWHLWTHLVIGTAFESGLELSGYTTNTDSLAAIQVGLSDGTIRDEDIVINIKNAAIHSARFEQEIAYPAKIPVLHRSGPAGNWHRDDAGDCPYKHAGADTKIQYNKYVDAETGWIQEAVTDTYYVSYFIFATNDLESPIISIQGARQDATIYDAINNNTYEGLQISNAPFNEMHLLYRIILKVDSITYTNSYKAIIAIVNDIRSVTTNAIRTGTALDHSSLTQRDEISSHPATAVEVSASSFSGALSTTDVNVQLALAKINGRLNQDLNTTNAPTFAGLTASAPIIANSSVDVTATAGSDVLNIGTTNADVINIGRTGATVNMLSTTTWQAVENLNVTNQTISTNNNSAVGSGLDCGLLVMESTQASGSFLTDSADRTSWKLKATGTAGFITLTPGASGFTINQGSHNPLTIGTSNGLSIATQELSLGLSSTSTTGALTSTDWNTFNGKQAGSTTLTALSAFNNNGIMVQTAANAFSSRSIVGTANQVAVANGDGIAQNPTISLPAALILSDTPSINSSSTLAIGNSTTTTLSLGRSGQITAITGNATIAGTTIANNSITLNATNELRFADTDSSNYVALRAAGSVASNITWTLPAAEGALNQAMVNDGTGVLSWATIPSIETRDYIPTPTGAFTYTPATNTAATANFAGGVYRLATNVTFSKVLFRTATISGSGKLAMFFYQTIDGSASSPANLANRIGGITSAATITANTTNAITVNDGTPPLTLKAGIVYVLWGLASGTSVQLHTYTGVSCSLLTNPTGFYAGSYPTTFTTAISATTTPATFDGSTQATPTASSLLPIIRLIGNF
jgi:hypothetical protein